MHLWRQCIALFAIMTAVVATLGNASPAAARMLCIGKESVLLRAGPSWRQDPVGSLAAGTCGVEVVSKCQSGWCEVAHGERRGWVDSRLVIVQEGPGAGAAQKEAAPPKQAAPSPRRQAPPPAREAAPAPPSEPARPAPTRATGSPTEAEGHCVMGVRAGDTLRVRSGPSAEHRELGGIPPNACGVAVGSPCQGSWCPVTYRGLKGWSNASYLRPPWMR